MDCDESSDREVFDELDLARPSNDNQCDHYDAADSQPEGNICYGHSQTDSLATPVGDVLPNPGVSRDDEYYFMGNPERGVALIFNHEKYDVRRHADRTYQPPDRIGANFDRDALRDAFESLDFEVLCFNDLCYYEISNELSLVADQEHGSRDCVAVAVLTHGNPGGRLHARDREYLASSLWEPFTASQCPSLAGKPKLFFIQACRGRVADAGVRVSDDIVDAPDDGRGGELSYPVPSYADILVSYSTFEGLISYRNPQKGSWYVQTLCAQLKAHGRTKDLVSLLTGVSRIVGQNFRSRNERNREIHGMVQAPCFTSSLTRRLCFSYSARRQRRRSSSDGCPKKPRLVDGNADDSP